MTSNPAATFSRTQVVWELPSGRDLALKGGRDLTPFGITFTILDSTSAGIFATGSNARLTNPAFLSLANLSFELLVIPTTVTANSFILRAGSPSVTNDVGLALRLFNSTTAGGFVWSMVRRGSLPGALNDAAQTSNGTSGLITFGQLYHVVCVAQDNQPNQIIVNGAAIPLTHSNTRLSTGAALPAGNLTGAIAIPPAYEVALGDPSTTQNGFLGTLGRVIVYPYAVTLAQAGASARTTVDQGRVVGLGDESATGAANRGPVAVPHNAGPVIGNGTNTINIDVADRSFDANTGDTLTALVPSQGANGLSSIVGGQLRYRPNAATADRVDEVPFQVRDLTATTGLFSDSIVRVAVTAPPVAPPTDDIPLTGINVFPTGTGGTLRTNLVNAYNAATPGAGTGTTIWLPANSTVTGAALTFNRTGFTAAAPLVIRPVGDAWTSVEFNMRVVISGANHIFAGAGFNDVDGTNITLSATNARATRCRIIHNRNATCQGVLMVSPGGNLVTTGIRCDRNEVSIASGAFNDAGQATGESVCFRLGPTGTVPVGPRIERCWAHDCDRLPTKPGANGREGIQLGEGNNSNLLQVRAIVSFCLLHNVTNESEPISLKSSLNQLTNVILTGSGGSRRMTNRCGRGNTWTACRSTGSGGFLMWQRDHLLIGCEVDNTGEFALQLGNNTTASYEATPSSEIDNTNNRPAALNCELRHCTGPIVIHEDFGANFDEPIHDCRFRTHTGTLTNLTPSLGSDYTRTEDAPGTKPTIVTLVGGNTAATNVGPFSRV